MELLTASGNRVTLKNSGKYRYYITCGTAGMTCTDGSFNLYARAYGGTTLLGQTSGIYAFNQALGDYTLGANTITYPQTQNSSNGATACSAVLYKIE